MKNKQMKPRTLRAARAYFDFTLDEFAHETGISKHTIMRAEKGDVVTSPQTEKVLQSYFASKGLEVTDNGIKAIEHTVTTYEGHEGFMDFMWEVHRTVKDTGGEIVASNVDESLFLKWQGDKAQAYMDAMSHVDNLRFRILIQAGDTNYVATNYAKYRWVDDEQFNDIPFYIFGEKVAILHFSPETVRVFTIHYKPFSDYFRLQFERRWNNSKDPQ